MTKNVDRQYSLIALFCIATPSFAQAPVQRTTGTLAGKAVNSITDQPVARAEMMLVPRGAGSVMTVLTGAQGDFVFDPVQPGRYTLSVRREGYAITSYGAKGRQAPSVFVIGPGTDIAKVDFKLIPLGLITGRVVDHDGDPVRGAAISVGLAETYGGPPLLDSTSSENVTDDRGEFRISDLPEGAWFVHATPPPPRFPRRTATAVLAAYYPSAARLSAAQTIPVAPGQEVSGIKISLREGTVFRVQGSVSGSGPGVPLSSLELWLVPGVDGRMQESFATARVYRALAKAAGGIGAVRSDGSFELSGVEPGLYELTASPPGNGQGAFGRVTVAVGDQDVKGVVLPLDRRISLSWTLKLEEENWPGSACAFTLNPLDGDAMLQLVQGLSGAGGRFRTDNVFPGKYAVSFRGCRPGGLYVSSARLASAAPGTPSVLDAGLDLRGISGSTAIEVVLSKQVGAVTGIVREGDNPAPRTWLTLVPDPPGRERAAFLRTTSADDEGHFTILDAAPGNIACTPGRSFWRAIFSWTPLSWAVSKPSPPRFPSAPVSRPSPT